MSPSSVASSEERNSPGGFRRLSRSLSSLQVRFTILVVGLALTVGALVGTVNIEFSSMLVNRLHETHCRQAASLLAHKAVVDFQDGPAALHRLSQQIVRDDQLLFVSFMDPRGRTLAAGRARQKPAEEPVTRGFTPGTTIGSPRFVPAAEGGVPFLDVTYPVWAGGRHLEHPATASASLLGYVRIGFSLERTMADVAATMDLLIGITVFISALTVPLGFLLVRRMVSPLSSLSRTMSHFADGDLEARTTTKRTDEIGELAGAYNLMADKLAQKHHEILLLNAELEARVQQRTTQLRELAARDPLTGLYNRRHFSEVLKRSFAEARRYGGELACLMADLDNFKCVNDQCGHQRGDELLILVAITIQTELRSADVAARYGGDEFIVILPQTDRGQAAVLGQRIMDRLNAALADQFPECRVSMSLGIGCMDDAVGDHPDELIRAADSALYEAKAQGKNTIVDRPVPA